MKRKRAQGKATKSCKRPRVLSCHEPPKTLNATLLLQYYTNVCTLRQYLICRLPTSAKVRRRKLAKYGLNVEDTSTNRDEIDLLDKTLVGSHRFVPLEELESLKEDISEITQDRSRSHLSSDATQCALAQTDIIDICLFKLHKEGCTDSKISNLLCHGLPTPNRDVTDPQYRRVQSLRQAPWTILPGLLGRSSDLILVSMFLECGLFRPYGGTSNMIQVSGVHLTELKPVTRQDREANTSAAPPKKTACRFSDVRVRRHHMLYGRPERSRQGYIDWSLGSKHVLSRLKDVNDRCETVQVVKHIFPEQFKLRCTFCNEPIRLSEAEALQQDWNRSVEIEAGTEGQVAVPKRMKKITVMVRGLRARHRRTTFRAMLDHYCPRPDLDLSNSMALASPDNRVSAFCQAAVLKVFGSAMFGSLHNLKVVSLKIDHLIRRRKFETMSVHELLDGMRVSDMTWLAASLDTGKLSKTDFEKRRLLMAQFLFFVFDSFLMALIKGHFHVTESSSSYNRLFYFRHDVWQAMCAPAIKTLASDMYEPYDPAKLAASKRSMGINFARMLPKEKGIRLIVNLKRRIIQQSNGTTMLGRSVNGILQPIYQAIRYETQSKPELLGYSMFSVQDMLPQLKAYRQALKDQGLCGQPLYFAKVDVKGCFDSLPQQKVLDIVARVLEGEDYGIKRYGRAKLLTGRNPLDPTFGVKPATRFTVQAHDSSRHLSLEEIVTEQSRDGKVNSIYVDGRAQRPQNRGYMLHTLAEHILTNLVSLGGRVYRQKSGIAQGSVVSSLLCNLLYTQMQREAMSFVERPDSTLLRLIDDFLLITPCKDTATRFMQLMHDGITEYGVQISAEKCRTNFDMVINGQSIMLESTNDFAFCGQTINTETLDLGKDIQRAKKICVADTATVDYSRSAGQSFYRKMLNAMQVQMHGMLVSTQYNAAATVLANLYQIFANVALKSFYYVKALSSHKQPSKKLSIRAILDAVRLAHKLVQRQQHQTLISAAHVRWLACKAFIDVLQSRQTRYTELLLWCHHQLSSEGLVRLNVQLLPIIEGCT